MHAISKFANIITHGYNICKLKCNGNYRRMAYCNGKCIKTKFTYFVVPLFRYSVFRVLQVPTPKSVTRKPTSGRKRKGGESLSNQDKRVSNDEVPSTGDTPLTFKDIPTIVKAVLDSMPGSSTTNSDGIHPEESPGTLAICMCVLVLLYIFFRSILWEDLCH